MSSQDYAGSDIPDHYEVESQVESSPRSATEMEIDSPAPTQGSQSESSDESWGNTGPAPWEERNANDASISHAEDSTSDAEESTNDAEESTRQVMEAILGAAAEDPALTERILSSGKNAQRDRKSRDTGEADDYENEAERYEDSEEGN